MRHQGQKDLKADQDNKVIGSADARKDGQKVSSLACNAYLTCLLQADEVFECIIL